MQRKVPSPFPYAVSDCVNVDAGWAVDWTLIETVTSRWPSLSTSEVVVMSSQP